jgi:hypothetical protein
MLEPLSDRSSLTAGDRTRESSSGRVGSRPNVPALTEGSALYPCLERVVKS